MLLYLSIVQFLLYKKNGEKEKEMAHWVKCLTYKLEDLSLFPKSPRQEPAVGVRPCPDMAGRGGTETASLAGLVNSEFS